MRTKKLILPFILLLGLGNSPARAQDCSNPPSNYSYGSSWWSAYESWCINCGGSPNKSTQSCTPGPNWGGGGGGGYAVPGGGDPELMLMQMFMQFGFDLLGKQMDCTFNPNCDAKVQQRQWQQQQRQLQEQERLQREHQQKTAEEARRQQELERKARFEQTREKLLGEMRLQPGSGDLQPRNLGLETLAPRDLAQPPGTGAASLRAPLARASCGSFLLRKADEAAARGDLQEASFLSSEAAALMSEEKVTTAVKCPPPPEVPEIGEGAAIETPESRKARDQIEQALRQRSQFMSTMYKRVAAQGAEYKKTTEELREAQERKKQAEAQRQEARADKARLEAQLAAQPPAPSVPAAVTPPAAAPESDPAAASALAEALAAMEAAEAAYSVAESEVQRGLEHKADIENRMQETRSLFDEAKKDPAGMDKTLEKLGGTKNIPSTGDRQ